MLRDRCCFGIGDKLVGLGFVCNQHRAMGEYVQGGTGESLSSQAWLKEGFDVSLQSVSKGVGAMLVKIHCFPGPHYHFRVFIHFKKLALL